MAKLPGLETAEYEIAEVQHSVEDARRYVDNFREFARDLVGS